MAYTDAFQFYNKKQLFSSDGYLLLKFNDGTKKADNTPYYNKPEIHLSSICSTGYILGDDVWLLACVRDEAYESKEASFSLEVQEYKDGKYVKNDVLTKENIAKFKANHNLVAIHTNTVPSLKAFASALAQSKVLNKQKISLPVKMEAKEAEKYSKMLVDLLNQVKDGAKIKDDLKLTATLSELKANGFHVITFKSEDEFLKLPVLDDLTEEQLEDDEGNLLFHSMVVPFVGKLNDRREYESVIFGKPDVPATASSANYNSYGGSKQATLKEKVEQFVECLNDAGLKLEGSSVRSIANALDTNPEAEKYFSILIDISHGTMQRHNSIKLSIPKTIETTNGDFSLKYKEELINDFLVDYPKEKQFLLEYTEKHCEGNFKNICTTNIEQVFQAVVDVKLKKSLDEKYSFKDYLESLNPIVVEDSSLDM